MWKLYVILLFIPSISFSACANYGFTTTGATTANLTSLVIAGSVTVTTAGICSSLAVYLDTATPTAIRMCIYADNGTNPTTVITQSSSITTGLVQGWNFIPIAQTVVSASNYWVGFQYTNASALSHYDAGTGMTYATSGQVYGTFPTLTITNVAGVLNISTYMVVCPPIASRIMLEGVGQ